MKTKHRNNMKHGFTARSVKSSTITILGNILRQQRDNGEVAWCYFGDGVVFLSAPFALVFRRARFEEALDLEISVSFPESHDALNLLFAHCYDISQSAEGERALELFKNEFGWKPII